MEHLPEYPSQPASQPGSSKGHVTGLVHSTESFGSVDGPGIRFLVFCRAVPCGAASATTRTPGR